MTYSNKKFGSSLLVSALAMGFMIYLILSAQVVMALMPVLGAGGVYVEAGSIEGQTGKVYPEYQPDNPAYGQSIGTTTPECSGGIPMYVIDLQGEARATDFSFRKDVDIPFVANRWLSVSVENIAISGTNLKLFTSQFGGSELLLRNVRLREGKSDTNKWGPSSGEFYLEGGQGTDAAVPGLTGTDISAWLHGATGESIVLEPQKSFVNLNITYPTDTELETFYVTNGLFGYDLEDDNYDYGNFDGTDDPRVQRGTADGNSEYFPCTDEQIPVF
jgi:hypothetical protein